MQVAEQPDSAIVGQLRKLTGRHRCQGLCQASRDPGQVRCLGNVGDNASTVRNGRSDPPEHCEVDVNRRDDGDDRRVVTTRDQGGRPLQGPACLEGLEQVAAGPRARLEDS